MKNRCFVLSRHTKTKEVTILLLNEKITIIRKMNNLTQEGFAEELEVSRQAVSNGEWNSVRMCSCF